MSNKRYYWLKLKNDFFEDDTIAWLEEQENGKDYVLFYLKLALRSLTENGRLIRYVGERLIPYDTKALAKLTNTPADTVKIAMNIFNEIGLVTILETGEIYMNQLNELIGSETDSARRMRKSRALENANIKQINNVAQSDSDVQKSDIEIEKEIDIEIDKEYIPYKQIIDYLNETANKRYRNVNSHQRHIKARWNEGYRLDDFKKVIDTKTAQWLKDDKMNRYLQPSTLFGTKFDNYLNEEVKEKKEDKELVFGEYT